ncbi:hypothetical protein Tco_0560834 [Tanacetum coccineum]
MAARGGRNNLVARKVIDDLIDISGERSSLKYMKIFIEQQIIDHRWFIAHMRDEIRTSTNLISQLNTLISELEASDDYEEVFDLLMELRDDKHDEQDKVADFNRLIDVTEEKIHGKEIYLEMLEAEGNDVMKLCSELIDGIAFALVSNLFLLTLALVLCRIMETQAINDQDPLVNYDNDNENDNLGYQSKEYFDEVKEEDENNHSNRNVVKRGITRLYKFCRKYGKPDGIKLSVTFDALNRISGKHKALFLSFLGDMVCEHIGLKILSWKKVKSATAKMACSKSVYQHTIGQGGYALIEKEEIEPDEEPAHGTLCLKGNVNKDEEYPDDEIRLVGDKLVDHGTDAMTVVLGKKKGVYARRVGSGVTYERYFDLPRSRQASDERILLLQSQLDYERRERQEKELFI